MKDDRYKVPVSVQLILKKDNNVLLLRRYNTGFADGHYALPAGHVEENEEIFEVSCKEFARKYEQYAKKIEEDVFETLKEIKA